MLIQKIVFREGEHPSLYFRGGSLKDGKIKLKAGERLSFDTYFSSFTYTKYRKYTTAKEITFKAELCGEYTLMLCIYDGKCETVISSVKGSGASALTAILSELPETAILYPVIEAITDTDFISGEYLADAEAQDISCAIAICTYKREDYVKNNLKIIGRAELSHIDGVLVVDNGNTLLPEEIEIGAIRLFKNKNYGGSAGFTRGIIEAKRDGFSHVILMDDDIEIYPEAINRMTVFASILKDEYKNAHFSAAMLPQTKKYIQHEKGALWNGSHIESLNTGLDLREKDSLIKNLNDGPIAYGAWWCFCLPLSDVEEFGLPLPLFIKFDDVEYGTRTCRSAPIITMSGMAISHADFDLKYNMHLEYYTVRNQLIMLAVHNMQNRFGCLLRLMKVFAKHLFLYRYSASPIIMRAFSDFLLGADFIMNTDAEELNRSVMGMAPKAQTLSALDEWREDMRLAEYSKKSSFPFIIKMLLLGGHLIPRAFMKKDLAAISLPGADVGDSFMYKRTVQYQIGSDSGYVFEKSSPKFFACVIRGIAMSFKILFCYGRAKRSFIKNKEYITSEKFWKEYLSID